MGKSAASINDDDDCGDNNSNRRTAIKKPETLIKIWEEDIQLNDSFPKRFAKDTRRSNLRFGKCKVKPIRRKIIKADCLEESLAGKSLGSELSSKSKKSRIVPLASKTLKAIETTDYLLNQLKMIQAIHGQW
jgi:hypothetical protein